jgi:hypothetical protein
LFAGSYDTYGDANAGAQLVTDSAGAPQGTIILAVVKDEASRSLSTPAKDVFGDLGSSEVYNLGFREGFAFVGIWGQKTFAEKRDKTTGFALTLGYAKKVKTTKKKTVVKGGSKFEVISAGFTVGNYATIKINDEQVKTSQDDKGGRGLNLVALDGLTHKIIHTSSYDTYGDKSAS